ncbi:endolytic transglycosylase MltG [Alkalicaulis satelles]|uniref:Endolytic murein transglycosylase n=1 Tax=Alkalicaulis satelles TaxID=2609175 RepID=A0A5M6ZMM9_9PROT|nr:endolytic transglycosylase MltG [Alkalicaulis satelles]KAA5804947.1 endolytic transglycosylase MltG [Alkalicaulis satelles]
MGKAPTRSDKPRSGLVARLLLWLAAGLVAAALIAAGAGYAGWVWLNQQFTAAGPAAEDTVVMLPRGSGLIAIASQLEREGVIEDARLFRVMVQIDQGERSLRAGEYRIPQAASMQDIYALLRSGRTLMHAVTAAEGLTTAMIVRVVEASDVLTGEITRIPAEGALLPETYMVDRGTPRQEVIDRMEAAQRSLLEQAWPNRADDLPFSTPEEAIIIASIVEKETGVAEERPLVASVFVNRLRRGMRLQSDPTIIYGITQGEPLGRGIRRSELDNANNPYNTYQINGLTPTPIANPGRASILAVLNPPDTNYLFFVADGTGGHAFSATYAEHNRHVAVWRRIERERAQGGRR